MKRQARCARERHIPFPSLGAVAHLEHPLCGGYRMPQPRGRGCRARSDLSSPAGTRVSSARPRGRCKCGSRRTIGLELRHGSSAISSSIAGGLRAAFAVGARAGVARSCEVLVDLTHCAESVVQCEQRYRVNGGAYRARGGELVHLVHLGVRNRARALRRLARRLGTGRLPWRYRHEARQLPLRVAGRLDLGPEALALRHE